MPLIDTCARHPQMRAQARCAQCNMWLCQDCIVGAHEQTYCSPECLQNWLVDREKEALDARNRVPGIRRGVRWIRWSIIGFVLLMLIHLFRDNWDFLYQFDLIGQILGT